MNIKEIREWCDEFNSIDNREKLKEAIPKIVEAEGYIASLMAAIRSAKKVLEVASDKAAKYVFDHPASTTEGMKTSPIGVVSCDVDVGGQMYHLVSGFGKLERADGDTLNQDFLSKLPEGWTVAKLELSATSIQQKYGKFEDYLSAIEYQGLIRPVRNKWSVVNDCPTTE